MTDAVELKQDGTNPEAPVGGQEQIMVDTKAEIKTNQEIMEVKINANEEKMDAWRKETTACQEEIDICLQKAKAKAEKTKAGLEERESEVDVFEEMLGKMDAKYLDANRKNSEAVAVHQEVPNEGDKLETVGAIEERYGDRRLAVWRGGRLTCRAPSCTERKPQS
jgi:NAD(P)H-dependent flavin oxidoreductase YrpB (nitropropane dioxygenase family)